MQYAIAEKPPRLNSYYKDAGCQCAAKWISKHKILVVECAYLGKPPLSVNSGPAWSMSFPAAEVLAAAIDFDAFGRITTIELVGLPKMKGAGVPVERPRRSRLAVPIFERPTVVTSEMRSIVYSPTSTDLLLAWTPDHDSLMLRLNSYPPDTEICLADCLQVGLSSGDLAYFRISLPAINAKD